MQKSDCDLSDCLPPCGGGLVDGFGHGGRWLAQAGTLLA